MPWRCIPRREIPGHETDQEAPCACSFLSAGDWAAWAFDHGSVPGLPLAWKEVRSAVHGEGAIGIPQETERGYGALGATQALGCPSCL